MKIIDLGRSWKSVYCNRNCICCSASSLAVAGLFCCTANHCAKKPTTNQSKRSWGLILFHFQFTHCVDIGLQLAVDSL